LVEQDILRIGTYTIIVNRFVITILNPIIDLISTLVTDARIRLAIAHITSSHDFLLVRLFYHAMSRSQ